MKNPQVLPNNASSRELQRNYRKLFDLVQNTNQPIFLHSHHHPEAVLLSLQNYEELVRKHNMGVPTSSASTYRLEELIGLFGHAKNLKKTILQEWKSVD